MTFMYFPQLQTIVPIHTLLELLDHYDLTNLSVTDKYLRQKVYMNAVPIINSASLIYSNRLITSKPYKKFKINMPSIYLCNADQKFGEEILEYLESFTVIRFPLFVYYFNKNVHLMTNLKTMCIEGTFESPPLDNITIPHHIKKLTLEQNIAINDLPIGLEELELIQTGKYMSHGCLKKLVNLKKISVYGSFYDFSQEISELTGLVNLNINLDIDDLNIFSKLTNLTQLSISNGYKKKIEPIEFVSSKLKVLSLTNIAIDKKLLVSLKFLEDLYYNNTFDKLRIETINQLTMLTTLNIYNETIDQPISLPNLKSLCLHGFVIGVNCIKQLSQLTSLHLNSCKLLTDEIFNDSLTSLELTHCEGLHNLSLLKLSRLNHLALALYNVYDFKIGHLTNLTSLDISHNNNPEIITDDELNKCHNLRSLKLSWSSTISSKGLIPLKQLEYLICSELHIDFSELYKFKKLKKIISGDSASLSLTESAFNKIKILIDQGVIISD